MFANWFRFQITFIKYFSKRSVPLRYVLSFRKVRGLTSLGLQEKKQLQEEGFAMLLKLPTDKTIYDAFPSVLVRCELRVFFVKCTNFTMTKVLFTKTFISICRLCYKLENMQIDKTVRLYCFIIIKWN